MFKLFLVLVTIFPMNKISFQHKLTAQETLAKDFMMLMRDGLDIRDYLSNEYILNHGLNGTDWQADYYLVKHFEITQLNDVTVQVKVDHGSGNYCTQFELEIVNEGGELKIFPSKFIYEPKIERDIVIPWKNVKKLC
jgi:hypothetical protein